MATPRMIDKLAWLHLDGRRVLMARSRGKTLFYLPGGTRDAGESDAQALRRETRDELAVALDPATLRHAHTFTAQADGQPAGVEVRLTAYFATHRGSIRPASEIEEIAWFGTADHARCSATGRLVLDWLTTRGLID